MKVLQISTLLSVIWLATAKSGFKVTSRQGSGCNQWIYAPAPTQGIPGNTNGGYYNNYPTNGYPIDCGPTQLQMFCDTFDYDQNGCQGKHQCVYIEGPQDCEVKTAAVEKWEEEHYVEPIGADTLVALVGSFIVGMAISLLCWKYGSRILRCCLCAPQEEKTTKEYEPLTPLSKAVLGVPIPPPSYTTPRKSFPSLDPICQKHKYNSIPDKSASYTARSTSHATVLVRSGTKGPSSDTGSYLYQEEYISWGDSPSVALSERNVPQPPPAQEVTLIFQPTRVGLQLEGNLVTGVSENTQAAAMGVQPYWRVVRVAGNPVERGVTERIAEAMVAGTPFEIVFRLGRAEIEWPIVAVPTRYGLTPGCI